MIDKNPDSPKFLDKDEPCFPELRGGCDNMNRDLHTNGLVCHAPVITPKEGRRCCLH